MSDEETRRVRERHRDLVEAWLDFADFAAALFKLHEKYGIANGDAGYAAYRKHLRKKYEAKLASKGLTVDPLNEGCRCIYCKLHSDETEESTQAPAEVAPVTEPTPPSPPTKKVDRSILQHRSISPHSETHNRRRLGQVPAEPPKPHQSSFKIANQKLGLVPAYVQKNEASICANRETHTTRRLGQVPAEPPRPRQSSFKITHSKLGLVPAYVRKEWVLIGRSPPSSSPPSGTREGEITAPVRGPPKKRRQLFAANAIQLGG